ncbi:Porin D [Thauera humireducens]|uniref:OprD family porin n=1 Tax=Thauera humireducens TaxID=1134435 RepID=UPI002467AB0B|nr:OprD family porin [Thauera humireducens]CAH1746450.1 Porin D [Thauera humireducens]
MSSKLAALIVLGLASASPALAAGQADAKGFVEDSALDVLLRNAYINRDYKDGRQDSSEWGQGVIANFSSGFTQGTVGVGVDAFAAYGLRLDSTRRRSGNGGIDFFIQDSNGNPEHDIAKGGASLKLRLSSTVLAYGDLRPSLPVLNHDDSRLLPESFTGTMLTSKEIDGLEFVAGTFHAQSRKSDEGRDSGGLKGIDVIGASYAFNDVLSASLYASDVDNVVRTNSFKRQYLNLNYTMPIASNSLTFDFNGYNTKYDVSNDKNRIWSLAATYATGPHAFTLAYQRSSGDVGYDYGWYQNARGTGNGGGSIWLANSYWSDFNGKDEKSWQIAYSVDFAQYGFPGLSYRVAYVRGSDIDAGIEGGPSTTNGKEHEFFNQLSYKVQSGAAKDLNVRLRASALRVSNDAIGYNNSGNEVRIFIDYPFSVF